MSLDVVDRRGMPSLVSVVAPAHNEEGNVALLLAGIEAALTPLGVPWELLFVDDGSRDQTWSVIRSLTKSDGRVRGLRFPRNFGHQAAVFAGMSDASGDVVITMDADLQHPPSVLPELIDHWRDGYDVVKTIRENDESLGFLKRFTSALFYRVFSILSGVEISAGVADFRLLDRRVIGELCRFREEGLFIRGLVEWLGFPSISVPYTMGTRMHGTPSYGLARMLKFAWHGISSFSIIPLRMVSILGVLASGASFLMVMWAIIGWMFSDNLVPGWASTLATVSFLFGVIFLYLSVLTEYVGRIFLQVRQRPLYVVSERLGGEDPRG